MRRFLITVATGTIGWVVCWFSACEVSRTKGPHSWFNACVALGRLESWAVDYGSDHGTLPDEDILNGLIERVWKENWSENGLVLDDSEQDLEWIVSDAITLRSRWLWGQRPTYIVDPSLPQGCGFYLMGEDGKSMARGRDPDDLRSWDMDSREFYYRRLYWRRSVSCCLWAIPPAAIAAWLAWRLTKPQPKPVLRGRYDGAHLPE